MPCSRRRAYNEFQGRERPKETSASLGERGRVAQIMVSKREEREGGGEASLRSRTATVRARIRSKEKGGDEGK